MDQFTRRLRAINCPFWQQVESHDPLDPAVRQHFLDWAFRRYDSSLYSILELTGREDADENATIESLVRMYSFIGLLPPAEAEAEAIIKGDSVQFLHDVLDFVLTKEQLVSPTQKATKTTAPAAQARVEATEQATKAVAAADGALPRSVQCDAAKQLLKWVAKHQTRTFSSECVLFPPEMLLTSKNVPSRSEIRTLIEQTCNKLAVFEARRKDMEANLGTTWRDEGEGDLEELVASLVHYKDMVEAFQCCYVNQLALVAENVTAPALNGLGKAVAHIDPLLPELQQVLYAVSMLKKSHQLLMEPKVHEKLNHLNEAPANLKAIHQLMENKQVYDKSFSRQRREADLPVALFDL